jgi:hypothetical protein
VVNDRTVDEQLSDLLGWSEQASVRLSWDEVESLLGVRFPDDYKRLMNRFPSGAFSEYFYLYSPIQSGESLDTFRQRWEADLAWLVHLRDDESETIPYPIYPESGGLIPWGLGDEQYFYWKTNTLDDPDTWNVVFTDHLATDWGEYSGNVSSFLLDAIGGRFEHPHLYYETDDSERNFTPYDRFL